LFFAVDAEANLPDAASARAAMTAILSLTDAALPNSSLALYALSVTQ
jgi:hypothetical protein